MKNHRIRSLASTFAAALAIAALGACTSTQPAKVQFDDSAITTAVKAEMVKDPVVSALAVDVTTNEGVVVLTGRVKTAEESAQAEKIARDTNGVKRVRNLLKVGPMSDNPNQ